MAIAKHSKFKKSVDIGGTFTDVVLEKDGQLFSSKILTTYVAPENAIIEGMAEVCSKSDVRPSEIGQIIHGTTLATNALIERRRAKTALITTQDDGSPIKGKGKRFVPHGRRGAVAFPGGAGYGDPKDRPVEHVKRDLARGYISAQMAAQDYGLSATDIAAVEEATVKERTYNEDGTTARKL